jgi:hypothetical protein
MKAGGTEVTLRDFFSALSMDRPKSNRMATRITGDVVGVAIDLQPTRAGIVLRR